MFYRCFSGVSNVFLCPLQRGGGRLWWIQHGTSQVVSEESAACTYPCDTGKQCSSAGGVLVDNGNQISESQQEAETSYKQSPCSNQTTQTGQTGTGQTSAGQTGTGQTAVGQTSSGQTNVGQVSGVSSGQTGGNNQGTSSSSAGKLLLIISYTIK